MEDWEYSYKISIIMTCLLIVSTAILFGVWQKEIIAGIICGSVICIFYMPLLAIELAIRESRVTVKIKKGSEDDADWWKGKLDDDDEEDETGL